MKRLALAAALAAANCTPVSAQNWDVCADLWLTRTMLLDRAGQCLDDPDAAALFGRENCEGAAPDLSAKDREKLEIIAAREAELGCDESDLLSLRTMRLDLRTRLEDLPIPMLRPRSCLYWTGDPVYLLAAPDPASADLGAAQYGDDIFWEHDLPEMPEGWTFVAAYLDGQLLSLGWTEAPIDTGSCGTLVDWNLARRED